MEEGKVFAGLDILFVELTKHWTEKYTALSGVFSSREIFIAPVVALLFIMQKVSTRNSLSSALEYLQASKPGSGIDKLLGGSRRIAMHLVSSSTGGISQARERLSLKSSEELFEEINLGLARLNKRAKESGDAAHKKKRWFLLDGTTIGLQNTKAIKARFPSLDNQQGECRPCLRAVFGHNLYDAVAQHPAIGTMTDSEQALGNQVMDRLAPGSGVIGDRNFGVFSVAYHAQKRALSALVRMTEVRAASLIGKKTITEDGTYEVEWKPSKKDRSTNPDLPATACVPGKVIIVTVERYGQRTERMFLFTTDTQMSTEQAVAIYKERWLIENDIRTLKSTVNLNIVYAKTPDMAIKEILFGIIAYNMIRALIAKAVVQVKLKPRDISFTRAVGIIINTAMHLSRATTALEADITISQFYKKIYQVRHPTRSAPRFEPRAIVSHSGSRFPGMKGSRIDVKAKMLNDLR